MPRFDAYWSTISRTVLIAGIRLGRRRVLASLFLLLLLLVADAAAQTPGLPDAGGTHPRNHEPITPIPAPPKADPLKVALGGKLFQDPRLSHDGKRACSSCHDPHSNGADGKRFDTSPQGVPLAFNTPTVFNAALDFRLDWEGDIRTFEAQAESSLENPMIMATSMQEVLARLNADRQTVSEFLKAYGRPPDRENLLDAISTYERSLLTPGSRFDKWLEGDDAALSEEELKGYRLFKSLGCISCHQGVNVGGNLFQRHGVFHPLASPKPEILRVPSLRNAAVTPPYFHDGSAPTLEDAIQKMGEAQLDRKLSKQQIDALVAFIRSLTGTYRGAPVVAAKP